MTTATRTIRKICEHALRKATILGFGEPAPAEDMAAAVEELDVMLKAWQNLGYNLWTKTDGSLVLTTAASYELSPERPLKILNARVKRSGIETPMTRMTRQEYDDLPQKNATGFPTQFYYDRQREEARFYVWPVLAVSGNVTVEYTYERELADVASENDTIDVPVEWYDAIINNLAVRLSDSAGVAVNPRVAGLAVTSLEMALGADTEGSVFFGFAEAH